MIQIPIPRTITGSQFTPKLQSYNINQISTQGAHLQRPACEIYDMSIGSTSDYDYTGEARAGMFRFIELDDADEKLMYVYGNEVYLLNSGTPLSQAAHFATKLNGGLQASFAMGYNGVAMCAGGEAAFYSWSASDITALTDPDLPDVKDVTWIDGRFVWTPTNGDPLIYSEVNDAGNIDALSFFDAEASPDFNLATVNIQNDLFVLGSNSIERFRHIGTPEAPFLRVNNSIISVGYVGGLVESKDSFLFLGRDKDGGYAFFTYTSGQVIKVSSAAVTEDLNLNYTDTELEACTGQRFNWGGHDCYVFTLSDKDYLFNVETGWSYIMSGTSFGSGLWGFGSAQRYLGTWYVQADDGLYALTTGDNDIGRGGDNNNDPENFTTDSFIRGVQIAIVEPLESVFVPSSIEVAMEMTTTDSDVDLSVSDDGITWSSNITEATGTETTNRLIFQDLGGLGSYDAYMGVRISSTSNVSFNINKLVMT